MAAEQQPRAPAADNLVVLYLGALLLVVMTFAAVFFAQARWLLSAVLIGIGVYLLLLDPPIEEPSREAIDAWAKFGDHFVRKIELAMGVASIAIGLIGCALLTVDAVNRRKRDAAQRPPRGELPRAHARERRL